MNKLTAGTVLVFAGLLLGCGDSPMEPEPGVLPDDLLGAWEGPETTIGIDAVLTADGWPAELRGCVRQEDPPHTVFYRIAGTSDGSAIGLEIAAEIAVRWDLTAHVVSPSEIVDSEDHVWRKAAESPGCPTL